MKVILLVILLFFEPFKVPEILHLQSYEKFSQPNLYDPICQVGVIRVNEEGITSIILKFEFGRNPMRSVMLMKIEKLKIFGKSFGVLKAKNVGKKSSRPKCRRL